MFKLTTFRASIFIVASALSASLASLTATLLVAECGYYSPLDVTLAVGLIGSIVSALWWLGEKHSTGLLGSQQCRGALILRGVSGCLANASAWFAFSNLTMATANTIMFTSPVFMILGAHLFLKQPLRRRDGALSFVCLGGVFLVADPASALPDWGFAASEPRLQCLDQRNDLQPNWKRDGTIGGFAAVSFSIASAISSLLINTRLRNESTATITFWPFACIAILAWPSAVFSPGILSYGFRWGSPSWRLALLALLNISFQWLRARGFQISRDASVSAMMYTEVAFSFVLGRIVLLQAMPYLSMIGALLVCASAFVQAYMQHADDKALPADTLL